MKARIPKLIIISAPSGAGKTTLCQRLVERFKDRLVLSISATTRAPRGKERHGVEYFFLSREDFEQGIQEKAFAEWARVHDNFYGTPKAFIENSFQNGFSVLLDIDVQGADSLSVAYPGRCFRIFIAPPSLDELRKRLIARGTDTAQAIEKRIENARQEMKHQERFDAVIINDILENAYQKLEALVSQQVGP